MPYLVYKNQAHRQRTNPFGFEFVFEFVFVFVFVFEFVFEFIYHCINIINSS